LHTTAIAAAQNADVSATSRDSTIDWVVDLAPVVGIALAAIAAWVAYRQFKHARREAHIARTLAFLEQMQDDAFQSKASLCMSYIDVEEDHEIGIVADCVEKIQAWELAAYAGEKSLPRSPRAAADSKAPSASINDVLAVFSFLERLGESYNQGLLDTPTIHRVISRNPIQIFITAWWFVVWQREGELTDLLYRELETFVLSMRSHPDLRDLDRKTASSQPHARIRVLVLPDRRADSQSWELCVHLSERLSRRAEAALLTIGQLLDVVAGLVKADGTPGAGPTGTPVVHRVLAVPRSIEVRCSAWAFEERAARDLCDVLADLSPRRLAALTRALLEQEEADPSSSGAEGQTAGALGEAGVDEEGLEGGADDGVAVEAFESEALDATTADVVGEGV
jgi:hypothetical protein